MACVSVVVPIYNVENYLRECLTSVVNQTLKDIEIICVNDGSTDKSFEIIEEFAKNDNRIKVISQQNGGLGKAYNTGLANATGEYVGLVESDDYIDLTMFEDLYNCAKSSDADIVKSDFYMITEDNLTGRFNKVPDFYNDKVLNPLDFTPYIYRHASIWTSIYKNSFLKKHNLTFNETPRAAFQDVGFCFKTWLNADKIYAKSKPYYYYRLNANGNSTNRVDIKAAYMFLNEYKLLNEYLKTKEFSKEQINIKVKQEYLELMINYNQRFRQIFDKYKYLKELSKEFNEQIKNNEVDKDLFNVKEWEEYSNIAQNPVYYLVKSFLNKIALSKYFISIEKY